MADFNTPPLFDAPARGNPLEFLDETYLAKTRIYNSYRTAGIVVSRGYRMVKIS